MSKPLSASASALAELVDQFAPVREQVDQFRPILNLHDRLWERIKPHLHEKPGNQVVTLQGAQYKIEISECAMQRQVKPSAMDKLKKVFGAKRFWAILAPKFPVTSIDAMLNSEQSKGFLEETQTGARRIMSVARIDGPAAPKAA
jgi:hypothetical protein